jgi:hypothetical protein
LLPRDEENSFCIKNDVALLLINCSTDLPVVRLESHASLDDSRYDYAGKRASESQKAL